VKSPAPWLFAIAAPRVGRPSAPSAVVVMLPSGLPTPFPSLAVTADTTDCWVAGNAPMDCPSPLALDTAPVCVSVCPLFPAVAEVGNVAAPAVEAVELEALPALMLPRLVGCADALVLVFVFPLAVVASAAPAALVVPSADWTTAGNAGTLDFTCAALPPALASEALELLGRIDAIFIGGLAPPA
jgi:hypothetical protein